MFSPHSHTLPSVLTTPAVEVDTDNCIAPVRTFPLYSWTFPGVTESSPTLPNCPSSFLPQVTTWPFFNRAAAKYCPAPISITSVKYSCPSTPFTCLGSKEFSFISP